LVPAFEFDVTLLPYAVQSLLVAAQSFSRTIDRRVICFATKKRVAARLRWQHEEYCSNTRHDVDQVMNRWPASIRVFMDFRMSCIGCPIATFHSVDEATREHAIDPAAFMSALQFVAM
jgi:hybrid cluster-associated redox disulfide protein